MIDEISLKLAQTLVDREAKLQWVDSMTSDEFHSKVNAYGIQRLISSICVVLASKKPKRKKKDVNRG
jgi:hypothetical protein